MQQARNMQVLVTCGMFEFITLCRPNIRPTTYRSLKIQIQNRPKIKKTKITYNKVHNILKKARMQTTAK